MARQRTSFSELSTLAECERKWAFRYRDGLSSPATKPMVKGTIVHEALAAWWSGADWAEAFWESVGAQEVSPAEETIDDSLWLVSRYVRWYAADRPLWKVVANELELKAKLPRVGNVVLGYIDQIMEDVETGELWLVERKTMSDWQRLSYLSVDPQLTLYAWLVRENGWDVRGILFDAIRTYRWAPTKPTQRDLIETSNINFLTKKAATEWARLQVEIHPGVERDLADSFQWLTQDRTDDHIRAALEEAIGAVRRRLAIRRGARPLRNLGRNCNNCFFKTECYSELAFTPQLIIVEDD